MASLLDIYAEIRKSCADAGGQTAWAKAHGVSVGYVNDVLNGRTDPGPKILSALGYRRVITYQRSNPA